MKKYIDWEKAKMDYVTAPTDDMNLIAQKHNVSIHTVRNRATREKWVTQRSEYKEALTNKTREKLVEKTSNEYSRVNKNFRKIGEILKARAFAWIEQKGSLGPTEFYTLAKGFRIVQQMLQTAYGQDIPGTEIHIGHKQVIQVLNEYRQKKLEGKK